jgi:predicted RNA methylase
MQPYYQEDNITLYHGDLREVLPVAMQPNAVDFVVTDPPYGLCFMEKDWDFDVPGPSFWEVISNICKPGAFLLAFGGTRTFHRLICAIEDAGWEIRDCLMWLHGQGFPKSLDISKAIDKQAGVERAVIGEIVRGDVEKAKTNGSTYAAAKANQNNKAIFGYGVEKITIPATHLAKCWEGWGTALKPAWEPIILAMKPLDGTFATNAVKHGVAGLNINAGRIGTDDRVCNHARSPEAAKSKGKYGDSCAQETHRTAGQRLGRFPANLLLDEEAAQELDAQSGTLTSGKMKPGQQRAQSKGEGGYHGDFPDTATANGTYGDSGGASRFFYCSKASKKERGPGNDHPTVKPLDLMEYLLTLASTPNGGIILDPFAGSGTTLVAAKRLGRQCVGVELDAHSCEIAAARLNSINEKHFALGA